MPVRGNYLEFSEKKQTDKNGFGEKASRSTALTAAVKAQDFKAVQRTLLANDDRSVTAAVINLQHPVFKNCVLHDAAEIGALARRVRRPVHRPWPLCKVWVAVVLRAAICIRVLCVIEQQDATRGASCGRVAGGQGRGTVRAERRGADRVALPAFLGGSLRAPQRPPPPPPSRSLARARGHGAGTVPIVRLLLSHGADPNVKDEMGQTPIFTTKSPQVILELVAGGADPNATDCWGLTPMMYATLNDKFVSQAADPRPHMACSCCSAPSFAARKRALRGRLWLGVCVACVYCIELG